MKEKELAPMTIQCGDCSQDFPFTTGEQEFYAEKGFTPPKRCPDCRAARKARRDARHE